MRAAARAAASHVAARWSGGDRGRRALLDQLLVVALHGAVALAEVDGVTVAIGEHLDLDVAAALDQLLDVDAVATERGARLGLRLGVRGLDLTGGARDPHAATAAAVLGLEQDRIADRVGDAAGLVGAGEHAVAAGDGREAGGLHRGLRPGLAAHHRGDLRRRADERHAVLGAQRREQRVLRQKAPARVQRRAPALHRGLDHALDIEIALCRAAGPEHDVLAAAQVGRVAIGLARRRTPARCRAHRTRARREPRHRRGSR